MRKTALIGAAAAALLWAAPAAAQYAAINDVIAQTIMSMNQGYPDTCYTEKWAPKPNEIADGSERSEKGMADYLKFAAAGTDLSEAYAGRLENRHWKLDGIEQDTRASRDPWVARIARIERVDLRVGNAGVTYRGLWRAYAADGTPLGTYEALLLRKRGGSRLNELALHSPGGADQPAAATPFCVAPGDIEKWQEAKAKRAAEKAARRAAKEAARAANP